MKTNEQYLIDTMELAVKHLLQAVPVNEDGIVADTDGNTLEVAMDLISAIQKVTREE